MLQEHTPAGSAFKLALYSSGDADLGTVQQLSTRLPADASADPTNNLRSYGNRQQVIHEGGNALTNTGVATTVQSLLTQIFQTHHGHQLLSQQEDV